MPDNSTLSLQKAYALKSICYGCGPANTHGLKVESFVEGDEVICRWIAQPFHEAFPGVLNGGIIGSILDCHSNWAAAWYIMQGSKLESPPSTVTADYHVKLLRPTPSREPVELRARLKELHGEKAIIEAKLFSGKLLCATCLGTFVAVKPGHPAYHRW